jgi:predicted permease
MFLGVIVLICGMPAAASTPILAQAYGGNCKTAAESVFLSTMLSIFTIPLLALLLV